jgi:hypothetical protein
MTGKLLFPLVASVLVVAPLLNTPIARAQRGGGRVSVGAPAMTGRRGSGMTTNAPSRTSRRGSNSFLTSPFTGTNLFPGGAVGINGINAVTTPGNLGVEAAIDPATQWNLALAQRVLSNTRGIFPGGGFYLLTGGGAYALPEELPDNRQSPPAQQQQPQVIVLQQAPPTQQRAYQTSEGSEGPAAPPLPDAGQFTLVLHDGKRIEAVAFTRMKDKIVYITVDGSRRTIAPSELDADTTIRVNQERGTPLQLPL